VPTLQCTPNAGDRPPLHSFTTCTYPQMYAAAISLELIRNLCHDTSRSKNFHKVGQQPLNWVQSVHLYLNSKPSAYTSGRQIQISRSHPIQSLQSIINNTWICSARDPKSETLTTVDQRHQNDHNHKSLPIGRATGSHYRPQAILVGRRLQFAEPDTQPTGTGLSCLRPKKKVLGNVISLQCQ